MSYIDTIVDPEMTPELRLVALKEVEHDLDTQRQNSNFSFPMRQQLQREWFAVVQEINKLVAEQEPKTGVAIETIFIGMASADSANNAAVDETELKPILPPPIACKILGPAAPAKSILLKSTPASLNQPLRADTSISPATGFLISPTCS